MYKTSGYSAESGRPSYANRQEGWTENFDFQDQRSRDTDRNEYGPDPRFRYESSGLSLFERENNSRRRHKPGALNFNKYAEAGNRFINEVAFELGTDRDKAARITRVVLHALRDRLPVNDAVEFAQGLPMALKGVFFDQYDVSSAPVIIRSKREFLEFIRSKDHFTANMDLQQPADVVRGLQAVFYVLENHMDRGQTAQIKRLLHSEIVDLIERGTGAFPAY